MTKGETHLFLGGIVVTVAYKQTFAVLNRTRTAVEIGIPNKVGCRNGVGLCQFAGGANVTEQ